MEVQAETRITSLDQDNRYKQGSPQTSCREEFKCELSAVGSALGLAPVQLVLTAVSRLCRSEEQ